MLISGLEFKDDGISEYITVTGIASPYNEIDQGDDCVLAGAYTNDLNTNGKTRPCLWQHSTKDVIGNNYLMDMINYLSVQSKLPRNDDLVKGRVLPQLKCGSLGGYSIGYETINAKYRTVNGKSIRDLTELKLHEVSIVTIPMAKGAVILSVSKAAQNISEFKSFGTDTTDLITELSKTLNPPFQALSYLSDDTAWNKKRSEIDIKEHNGKEDCYIGGYPVVYWTEKGFKAVPNGIYAAAASMIDTKDDNIKNIINTHYKALNEDPLFDNGKIIIGIHTLKSMNKKEFCSIFENNYKLSKSAKEYLSDGFKGRESVSGNYEKNILTEIRQARMLLELKI